MSTDRGPLPDDVVGAIFTKLSLTYGQRFSRMYEQPMDVVRAHWALELSGMSAASIRYALDHLPLDYAPNCLQFRNLGSCRPHDDYRALPAPQASPSVREKHRAALRELREVFASKAVK